LRMVRPSAYFLIFLSLGIFEGYSKKYLIETHEGALKKKNEHGADYYGGYNPKPYGHQPQPYGGSQSEATCVFDSWQSWSSQSVKCGTVTQTQRRDCKCSDGSTSGCSGQYEQTRQHDMGACFTCQYGPWTSWSGASATCGTSTSSRTRCCECTDGVTRTGQCVGQNTESKQTNPGPCQTKWVPKPYRGKKRRMKRRRRM